ncbi:MAG: hypothetical protein FWC43_08620 [Planctomycetaceae bacterium]|nr:hypothetical protein [Planctomycetaceae bacterium]
MIRTLLVFSWLLLSLPSIFAAEIEGTPWEWTPYSLGIYLDADQETLHRFHVREVGDLIPLLRPQIEETFRNWIGGLWTPAFETGSFPEELFDEDRFLRKETPSSLESEFDKHTYLRIESTADSIRVEAREWDIRTGTAFGYAVRTIDNDSELADAIFQVVLAVFSPIAVVEQIQSNNVVLRLRGGELIPRDVTPNIVGKGRVFVPFIRVRNSSGQVETTRPIPWTVLLVDSVQQSRVECSLEAGIRNPLTMRRRGRTEQIAILPHLEEKPTRLLIQARTQAASSDSPRIFTAKYGIFEREPDSDRGVLLGESNALGEFIVPYLPGSPIRRLMIREGNMLIARLPLVQGWKSSIPILVPDDEVRIAAESVMMGIQEEVIDQITLRMILKARIEKYEKSGNTQGLAKAKIDFERLKSREHFLVQLELERRKYHSSDPIVQKRLENMFEATRKIIEQYYK